MKLPAGDTILQFGKGDQNAFTEIFNHFCPPLVYFATKLTDNEEEAEDIVLETFVKLWDRREHFGTALNIKAFLYITVRNSCLNYIKYRKGQNRKKKEYGTQEELWDDATAREYTATNTLEILRQEVENLPGKCKEVCKLQFFEGMSNQEIAEKLGMKIETVYSNKKYALKLLKTRLLKNKLYNVLVVLLLLEHEPKNFSKNNCNGFTDLAIQSCFYYTSKPDLYDYHKRSIRNDRKTRSLG